MKGFAQRMRRGEGNGRVERDGEMERERERVLDVLSNVCVTLLTCS